jgi:molybdopterin converting factor small subunit
MALSRKLVNLTGALFILIGMPTAFAVGEAALTPEEVCVLRQIHEGNVNEQIADVENLLVQTKNENERSNGAILAAKAGINPDYDEATWIRDSARVRYFELMQAIGASRPQEVNSALARLDPAKAREILNDHLPYIDYLRKTQAAQANFGLSLGEPRFRVTDGGVVLEKKNNPDDPDRPKPWGRTQNDSPAHAAKYLALLGRVALKAGKEDWVTTELFDDKWPDSNGTLKRYTEYITRDGISHGNKTYEAWEEKLGHHYDTALAQIVGLFDTANLVDELAARKQVAGDTQTSAHFRETAAGYRKVAQELYRKVQQKHWTNSPNEKDQYIIQTIEPDESTHPEKTIQRDALVINSIVHGQPYAPSLLDEKVLSTVALIEDDMREIMPASSIDPVTGVVPIGRYKQDVWDGTPPKEQKVRPWRDFYSSIKPQLDAGGDIHVTADNLKFYRELDPSLKVGDVVAHGTDRFKSLDSKLQAKAQNIGTYPWTLLTATWLNFYSSIIPELKAGGDIHITAVNQKFYRKLDPTLSAGDTIPRESEHFNNLITKLQAKADGYGYMVLKLVGPHGETGEGFNPVTLGPAGPRGLTWNTDEINEGLAAWKKTRPTQPQ